MCPDMFSPQIIQVLGVSDYSGDDLCAIESPRLGLMDTPSDRKRAQCHASGWGFGDHGNAVSGRFTGARATGS